MSPALNQTTTATQVIDRLEEVLLRILRRPPGTRVASSTSTGSSDCRVHAPSWEELLDLAFVEIAVYGASSPQIARRPLAVYRALADAAPGHLRPGIEQRYSTLLDLVDATAVEPVRAAARHPDRLGLG